MKLFKLFGTKHKKTVVVIQCRLSSTRLPQKALKPLGGKTVVEWVLNSMKNVLVDEYYLATDEESAPYLKEYAEKYGYNLYAGSREDVLQRFCDVIKISEADVVIRATADNPFLFYEAADALFEEYVKRDASESIDYITYSGLPHGSGVEIFNAHSLLKAKEMTEDPYDHEHVGPALYNHKENFKCEFLKAPKRYYAPELRTTIDTPQDYRRALEVVKEISGNNYVTEAYTTEQILSALKTDFIQNPVLLIPCTKKGYGTGHLRRCLNLASSDICDVYISDSADLEQIPVLIEEAKNNGLEDWQIIHDLNDVESYNLVIFDSFKTDENLLKLISSKTKVCCIDEGAKNTDCIDYVLDIIPGLNRENIINLLSPSFIELPENKRNGEDKKISKVLVAFGGEDPEHHTIKCTQILLSLGYSVTAILPANVQDLNLINDISSHEGNVKFETSIPNLKEKLCEYDLVVTHFGFTAFEAVSAKCSVILTCPTEYHEQLSEKYQFAYIPVNKISSDEFEKLLASEKISFDSNLIYEKLNDGEQTNLEDFVLELSKGLRLPCPVCQKINVLEDELVARTPYRTFRRCKECGMLYISYSRQNDFEKYNRSYFYEDYQKQYGKTYLEDFPAIKAQGTRRISVIDQLYNHVSKGGTPAILDIGCAMGPFLDAANDSGWQVYGTDISKDAVDHVQNVLHFPAVCTSFPEFNPTSEFGIQQFDAVTMWFVIEHFQNLDSVLKAVSSIVKKGGIFAFSTPSAGGVSAKYNTKEFFEQSPEDHFSIWEPKRCASILKKYGFKVEKIVSTGIHPERFPSVKKSGAKEKSFKYNAAKTAGKFLKLGDTFEVYCKKI